jgi:hypothetical protein
LVSRWSGRLRRVETVLSRRRRRRLSSKCRSTFSARRARRVVLSTCVSSTRSGSRRVPSPPSHALGAPINGATRKAKQALRDLEAQSRFKPTTFHLGNAPPVSRSSSLPRIAPSA